MNGVVNEGGCREILLYSTFIDSFESEDGENACL
jgi:hypothetical protein